MDAELRERERRARLVEAAVEVFGTTGYRTATVDRVCAEAGLTKRYFYESFSDSEQLLLAAYGRVIEEMRDAVLEGATAAGPDLGEQAHGALLGLFRCIDEDPRRGRIAFYEILGVSPTVDTAYRSATESFAQTLIAIAQPAFDVGPESVPGSDDIALGLVGAVVMIAQHWAINDRATPLEDTVAAAEVIVRAVVDRLRTV